MTYSVWHRGLGITLDLTEADLGHPEYPRLLDEIYGNYQPDLLYCLEAHEDEGFICPGFMAIRKVSGRPHAMHVAKGERPETKAESDLHKALGEYTADIASGEGFHVTRAEGAEHGKRRTDVTVEGADRYRLAYEIQLAAIAGGSVDERTRSAHREGLTPLWLVNNENAIPIDRAPWARLNVQSWRDVTDRAALSVRGGVKQLHMSRCDWSNPVPCPRQGAGRCGGRHGLWEPVRGLYYDDVIRRTGAGELVSLYMPHPAGRRGWHMWVTPTDKEEFLEGRPEPVPGLRTAPGTGQPLPLPGPAGLRDGDGMGTGVRSELTRALDDGQPTTPPCGTRSRGRPNSPVPSRWASSSYPAIWSPRGAPSPARSNTARTSPRTYRAARTSRRDARRSPATSVIVWGTRGSGAGVWPRRCTPTRGGRRSVTGTRLGRH